ncbi:MAG: diguanylate cyclase [Deltaproteobacteria bacterium]|nr:MAG: diguanylate cyclase [Deltaproteobacteria bacterium]
MILAEFIDVLRSNRRIVKGHRHPAEGMKQMREKLIKALLVEDNLGDARLMREMLRESSEGKFELTHVTRFGEAHQQLSEKHFDVVLLDLSLPDSSGLETFTRTQGLTDRVPIVVLTGLDDDETAIQAVQEGAQDYLAKAQVDGHLLVRSMRYAIERHRVREELRQANKKILEQQKSVIEEERLKVLLQMAGATAHELNQPLTSLLGFIGLLRMDEDNPDKRDRYISQIEDAGNRIASIVSKIQNIRQYDTKPYIGTTSIIEIDQGVNILSVEDSDTDFGAIQRFLRSRKQISLTRTGSIGDALQRLEKDRFDLILLDYVLPDGNGFEFITLLAERNIKTPIIVITGEGNEMVASQIMQAGADDYIPKDALSEKSLSRSIANTLEKARLREEIREVQSRMASMATRDELTGLYNRRYLMDALEREVARAKRYENDLVFCMIDLDHFKRVNDTYGHAAGDMVLTEIGDMLKRSLRKSDIPSRYGGEEFAVILPHAQEVEARKVCERFRAMVARHWFNYHSSQFQVTVSAGLASYSRPATQSPLDLVRAADQALYRAKSEGRNLIKRAIL